MTHHKMELSINDCFKAFDISFNRLKYFTCITDNLGVESLPCGWSITNKDGMSYQVPAPEEDKREYIISGYKHFIQRYLVRDCIESFALCLDELFLVLLLSGKTVPSNFTLIECLNEEEKLALDKFRDHGLDGKDGKIRILKDRFNLELPTPYKKIISSLKDIRDCLTHNNGIVTRRHGHSGKNNSRKFHWATFSVFLVGTKSGRKSKLIFNKPLREESNINIKLDIQNHSKTFMIGEQLSFSSDESYEIAWSLQLAAQEYFKTINQSMGDKIISK